MHWSVQSGLGDVAWTSMAFDGGSALEFSSKLVAVLSHKQGFMKMF